MPWLKKQIKNRYVVTSYKSLNQVPPNGYLVATKFVFKRDRKSSCHNFLWFLYRKHSGRWQNLWTIDSAMLHVVTYQTQCCCRSFHSPRKPRVACSGWHAHWVTHGRRVYEIDLHFCYAITPPFNPFKSKSFCLPLGGSKRCLSFWAPWGMPWSKNL